MDRSQWPKWLDAYSGQTTSQLLGLEHEFRVASLILGFEQAIDQKAAREGNDHLTKEEFMVLAIEALEREVNNGGYRQFFINSSREYTPTIVDTDGRDHPNGNRRFEAFEPHRGPDRRRNGKG